jgi:hypothetical protein
MTDKQKDKIKSKIRSFRATLSAEKRKFGGYMDSRGLRYEISHLYIKAEDYKGALRYYTWFEKEFSDDMCYPLFYIQWTFAIYKNNKPLLAEKKLLETAYNDIFILPILVGEEEIKSEDENEKGEIKFAQETSEMVKGELPTEFINWAKSIYKSESFQKQFRNFVGLRKLIEDEPLGKQKDRLYKEEERLIKELKN